jgi:hypothetical protein
MPFDPDLADPDVEVDVRPHRWCEDCRKRTPHEYHFSLPVCVVCLHDYSGDQHESKS